jgi:ribosomal protein S6E (S10)
MMRFFSGLALGLALAVMPALAAGPVCKSVKGKNIKPAVQQINMKIMGQTKKIQSALRAGKITPAQAKILREELQAVRKKEAGFFKQNKKNGLTADQQGQLDQMLLNNAKKMPVDPLESGGANMPNEPLDSQGAQFK